MALNNQPYLPLYVNDWLGNTKLKSCSAIAHGIMINVMLLMHKEEDYGVVLLKQKFKQTDQQILNFAYQFAKILPFDLVEITTGLGELLEEKILLLDGDLLKCARMMKDADISQKRALSGSKGGIQTIKATINKVEKTPKIFAQAKVQANADIDNDIIVQLLNEESGKNFKSKTAKTVELIIARKRDGFSFDDFERVIKFKCKEWRDDEKFCEYLRPETLFGNKFESYLNSVPKKQYTKPNTISQADYAKP